MRNRLPEKLTVLRKHFGYSQGDLAKAVGVQVADYLNWENGKSLPRVFQIKALADIFHVSLESLINNNLEVKLANLEEIGASVSIPFINKEPINNMEESVKIMPVEGVLPSSTGNLHANVSMEESTAQLSEQEEIGSRVTEVQEVIEDRDEEYRNEESNNKKKISLFIILATALLALALFGVLLFSKIGNNGNDINVSHSNRLAEASNYTVFIRENGKVQTWGDFPYESVVNGKSFVQVDIFDDNLIGLMKDGSIISNNNFTVGQSWKNIISVAAGRNHIVALDKDGKINCTGSSFACDVESWSDIKEVFAGNEITAAITNDNRLRIVGSVLSGLDGTKDVKTIDIGNKGIAIVKMDGSVVAYNLSDLTTIDTTGLSNIELVTIGSDFVAGVNREGKVLVASSDEDKVKAANNMNNISFIASDEDTFVALDRSGNIHGFGENGHGQYGNSATPTPSSETAKKLDTVQNITFDQTTSNVQVKWDAVKHANSYEISFSPSLSRSIPRSAGTSVSIPSSDFVKDQVYTVTIVAYASDSDKYEKSEPATVTFTYVPKTIQLNSPINVQALTGPSSWNIVWDPVEHADYYLLSVDDGEEIRTESLVYEYTNVSNFAGGSEHVIKIKACSNDEKYSESETTEARLIYEVPRFDVELNYVDIATQVSLSDNTATNRLTVTAKTYTFAELLADANLPVGYELAFPDNTIDIYTNRTIDVSVKSKASAQPTDNPEDDNKEGGNE